MLEKIAFFVMLVPVVHLALLSWAIAKTDWQELRIPNKYLLPNLALALVALVVVSCLGQWIHALGSFIFSVCLFLCLVLLGRAGMLGAGDVKLLTAVSLSLGYFSLTAVAVVVGLSILLFIGFYLVVRSRGHHLAVVYGLPFGVVVMPAYLVGVWLGVSGLV